jgi:23S rRNA (cytidine1920-2'-O)/16S rRNA (cytidine1409-2'-O)-methyltransferase
LKLRLDKLLVDRGLAASRERAQALVLAGKVLVNEQKIEKSGAQVEQDAVIRLLGEDLKYVSRGGLKLERALEHWHIHVAGKVCLDVGASTGGFTDCLLQHGAARVHAIDVGSGQLDWKLRSDARVLLRERLNARYLRYEDIGERIDLAVCDVSFISATLILPAIGPLLQPAGEMVVLVKPQFEVGRDQVGKGGIVRDPRLHQAACDRIETAVRQMNFVTGIIESPILGAEGNKEFLLYARH